MKPEEHIANGHTSGIFQQVGRGGRHPHEMPDEINLD